MTNRKLSIFDSYGQFSQTILIRSGVDLETNVVTVQRGSTVLGEIHELEAGEAGADTAVCDFVYDGFLPNGNAVSAKFADFEQAIAAIIERSDLV